MFDKAQSGKLYMSPVKNVTLSFSCTKIAYVSSEHRYSGFLTFENPELNVKRKCIKINQRIEMSVLTAD